MKPLKDATCFTQELLLSKIVDVKIHIKINKLDSRCALIGLFMTNVDIIIITNYIWTEKLIKINVEIRNNNNSSN